MDADRSSSVACALCAAVDNLVSNWASMVRRALAWNLKAWFALSRQSTAEGAAHREQKRQLSRMEFKRFVNTIMLMPCEIVNGGRRLIFRLLAWNDWRGVSCECCTRCVAEVERS